MTTLQTFEVFNLQRINIALERLSRLNGNELFNAWGVYILILQASINAAQALLSQRFDHFHL